MIFYISHPQDLADTAEELVNIRMPYYLNVVKTKPTFGTEKEKWNHLNSFFHRGIVPLYSGFSGLREDEAKRDLQTRFALVREHPDHYEVESVGGMSIERLMTFCEMCQTFLVQQFGAKANDLIEYNLKTKTVKK